MKGLATNGGIRTMDVIDKMNHSHESCNWNRSCFRNFVLHIWIHSCCHTNFCGYNGLRRDNGDLNHCRREGQMKQSKQQQVLQLA